MDNGGMAGTFHWIPAAENGPTAPFPGERITAFAYVGDGHRRDLAIRVQGLQSGGGAAEVTATWVDGYAPGEVREGDVITLVASQRPIARLEVTRVGSPAPAPT